MTAYTVLSIALRGKKKKQKTKKQAYSKRYVSTLHAATKIFNIMS